MKTAYPAAHCDGRAIVLLVGIAGVIWGAELMVDGAVALARQWGISEAVIALSLVAIGTSLPELAVSLVAATRGHAGLAVGNIIGSNISNILLILGVTAMVAPLPISEMMAMRDIPIMIGVACLGFYFHGFGARHVAARRVASAWRFMRPIWALFSPA